MIKRFLKNGLISSPKYIFAKRLTIIYFYRLNQRFDISACRAGYGKTNFHNKYTPMKLKALTLSALLLGSASAMAQESDDMYFFSSDRAKMNKPINVEISSPDEAAAPVRFENSSPAGETVTTTVPNGTTVQQNFYFNGAPNSSANFNNGFAFNSVGANPVYSTFGSTLLYDPFTGTYVLANRRNPSVFFDGWSPTFVQRNTIFLNSPAFGYSAWNRGWGWNNSIVIGNSWGRPFGPTVVAGSGFGWGGGTVWGSPLPGGGGASVANAWCPPSYYTNNRPVAVANNAPRNTASSTPAYSRSGRGNSVNNRVYAPRSSRGGSTVATRTGSTAYSRTGTAPVRNSATVGRGATTRSSSSYTPRTSTSTRSNNYRSSNSRAGSRTSGSYRPSNSRSSSRSSGSYRSSGSRSSSPSRSSGGSRSSGSSRSSGGRGGR